MIGIAVDVHSPDVSKTWAEHVSELFVATVVSLESVESTSLYPLGWRPPLVGAIGRYERGSWPYYEEQRRY